MNSSKVMLVAIWLQNSKDWDNTYKAIINKKAPDQTYIDEAKRYISLYGEENIIVPTDNEYQEFGLGKLKRPPFVVNLKECN